MVSDYEKATQGTKHHGEKRDNGWMIGYFR